MDRARLEHLASMGDEDAVDELLRMQYRAGELEVDWRLRALELGWAIHDGEIWWSIEDEHGVTYARMYSGSMDWIVFDSGEATWEYATSLSAEEMERNRFDYFQDDESLIAYAYIPEHVIDELSREYAEERVDDDLTGASRHMQVTTLAEEEAGRMRNDLPSWLEDLWADRGYTGFPGFVEVNWDAIPYRELAEQIMSHIESPDDRIFAENIVARDARRKINLLHGVAYRIK